jgi:probable phosphoglycerate mutase
MLLSQILGLSLVAVWHTLYMPTSSVTTVFMERHRADLPVAHARLVSVGDTSHLYAGGEPVSASGLFADRIR